jgi:hypothetical protein
MFVDDTTIFITPTKGDISMLAKILDLFGEVMGLTTNFQKSTLAPIQCNIINLHDVLSGMPATRTTFPSNTLGCRASSVLEQAKAGKFSATD